LQRIKKEAGGFVLDLSGERPEDWPWSSFLHHATGREGRIEIESEWTARKRERAAGRLGLAVALPHSSQGQA
jgi:hypothetical protein